MAAPLWVPVLAIVAMLVRLKLGAPVFFRQKRPGRGARIFEMIKFRTMTDARDAGGQLLPDAVRLTPFGKFLRSTSLDELPELLNVLRGDMSLVGPRPLLVHYLSRYSPRQARRHDVRPGITGLAQVKGFRGEIESDDDMINRIKFDVFYIDNWSLILDIKIIIQTVINIIKGEKKAY